MPKDRRSPRWRSCPSSSMTMHPGDSLRPRPVAHGGHKSAVADKRKAIHVLTGGAGADKFVYSALGDSTPAAFDIIQDFVHGTDKIDLGDIDANASKKGDQAFAFAGQNSGVVANSVTWYENGGNTFVQVDVNGNSTADLTVELTGINLHLTASDFFL
jgi:Ca2+-binding RTX toxin-like protein